MPLVGNGWLGQTPPGHVQQCNGTEEGEEEAQTREAKESDPSFIYQASMVHHSVGSMFCCWWGQKSHWSLSFLLFFPQISDVIIGLLCSPEEGSNIHFPSDKRLQLKLDPFPLGREGIFEKVKRKERNVDALSIILLLSRAQLHWQGPMVLVLSLLLLSFSIAWTGIGSWRYDKCGTHDEIPRDEQCWAIGPVFNGDRSLYFF